VLREPHAKVTAFSDRPARVGGAVGLRRFVARWTAAFGADPPNAALQLDRAPVGRDVVLLELRRPRHHRRARTLTFRVRPLRTTDRRQLSTIARRADRRVAARLGRASLFIDDGPSAFGSQVTFNLIGGLPSGAPVDFSLALGNTRFESDGELERRRRHRRAALRRRPAGVEPVGRRERRPERPGQDPGAVAPVIPGSARVTRPSATYHSAARRSDSSIGV